MADHGIELTSDDKQALMATIIAMKPRKRYLLAGDNAELRCGAMLQGQFDTVEEAQERAASSEAMGVRLKNGHDVRLIHWVIGNPLHPDTISAL